MKRLGVVCTITKRGILLSDSYQPVFILIELVIFYVLFLIVRNTIKAQYKPTKSAKERVKVLLYSCAEHAHTIQ